MATLTPLTVGNATAPTGQWATAANGALGDNSDATFGTVTNNATANNDQGWELANVDADFGTMDTLAVVLRYAWVATPNGLTTWDTLDCRIMDGATVLAAADSGGTFKTIASAITTTTITNSASSGFAYVNTGATKAQWDAAVVEIRIACTKSKGGDTTARAVYEADFTGTYTVAAASTNAPATLATATGAAYNAAVTANASAVLATATGTAQWGGASPAIRSSATYVSAASETGPIINVPAGVVDGDVLFLAAFLTASTGSISTPAGWTPLFANSEPASSTSSHASLFRRVASSEPANYTLTGSSGRWSVSMVALTGVDNTTPENATASAVDTTAGLSVVAPSVSPSVATLLLSWFGGRVLPNGDGSTPATWTPDAAQTEQLDVSSVVNAASNSSHELAYESVASGATGTRTAVAGGIATSINWIAYSVAVAPAAGGGTTGPALSIAPAGALATATAAAYLPSFAASTDAPAGLATATGAAYATAMQYAPAAAATATGAAQAPAATVAPSAGLATGTGAAYQPTLTLAANAPAGLATATGAGLNPTLTLAANAPAGLASATGAATNPTIDTAAATNAPADLATATGTAQAPAASVQPAAAVATATGTAYQPTIPTGTAADAGLATASGTALAAAMQYAPAGLASGTGTAANPTISTSAATSAQAGIATATGSATDASAWCYAYAGIATATGSANDATASIQDGTANATVAPATGVAWDATVTATASASGSIGTPGRRWLIPSRKFPRTRDEEDWDTIIAALLD